MGVGAPVHVPLVVVNVEPTVAVPETTGATVFTGSEPYELPTDIIKIPLMSRSL